MKDRRYESLLLNRQIDCTEWLTKQFEESVKQGDFMDNVVKQVKTDDFTKKLSEKVNQSDPKHLRPQRSKT